MEPDLGEAGLPSALCGHGLSRGDFRRAEFVPGPGLDAPFADAWGPCVLCVPGHYSPTLEETRMRSTSGGFGVSVA